MNRGNLAEDPKAGLSSSSRYSRDGGEKNSLLYVDSSTLRKERRAEQHSAGNQGSAIKGNHNSRKKKSVGRGLTDSHMDRLEVGSDGRLFQVKENSTLPISDRNPSEQKTVPSSKQLNRIQREGDRPEDQGGSDSSADSIRPAITQDVLSDVKDAVSGAKQRGRAKPERNYLIQSNPLLAVSVKNKSSEASSRKEKAGTEDPVKNESSAALSGKDPSSAALSGKSRTSAATSRRSRTSAATSRRSRTSAATSGRRQPPAAYAGRYQSLAVSGGMRNPLISVSEKEQDAAGVMQSLKGFLYRFRVPIIAGIVTAASIGYGFTAWHYRNRFYPGTEFFGIPAAEMSVYDIKAAVKAKVDSYSLELIAREPLTEERTIKNKADSFENVISAEDVGMVYRDNGEIDRAMENQKSWAWPVMMIARMIGKGDSALETTYDDHLVSEAVNGLACMQKENMIAPEDAKVILTDDGASVKTEIYGTTLDAGKTEEAVREALNAGSTRIDLDDLGLYKNPKVFCSDLSLMADAMAMNKVLGAKVLLRFGNRTEVINSKVISSMLDKKGSSYELNEEKLRAYVEDLAGKYDTFQKERSFYTSLGTTITLEEGKGDYGWQLDQDATFEKLLTAIRDQKKTTINPVYTQEAFCRDANDIGDTYVEISLTNQTMWFYKNGNLVVETPVVTGNPYAGHETPSGGVWSLKGRMRNQTLSGQGYSSPVDYWMPFNAGVGIHDMQSRAWFGGSIYLGSGSHGCINTPLSAVKLIYDQIEEGVPVILYKDESEEALAQITGPTDAQTLNAQIEETYGTVEDDGIGSIVSWSRYQRAQAYAAAAQTASGGTTAS